MARSEPGPPRSRSPSTQAGAAAWLLLASGTASAHSAAAGGGDFYAGVLHALSLPAHVLSFVAIGLLAGQHGARGQVAPVVFCVALIVGATGALWLPQPQTLGMFNLVCAAVVGGLVAASWALPAAILLVLAAGFGLSHGLASGTPIVPGLTPWLFVPGIGLAGLAVSTYGLIATDYLLCRNIGWMRIAVRVAGSWIAAIAILVLAISGAMPVRT